jgi:peptide/nickel transport system permease protein
MLSTFLLRRLLLAIPTLLGVSIVIFILLRVVPGNPIAMMVAPGASQEDIDHLKSLYGLDKPILQQYGIWLGNVLGGDFGTSITQRQNVLKLVFNRLPATMELTFFATLMALSAALLLACLGSYWRGSWLEASIDASLGFMQAIPDFLWALLFILLFGVSWPLLPISGRVDPRQSLDFYSQFYFFESMLRGRFDVLWMLFRFALLPALALALPLIAVITRLLKASLNETMTQDYIMMAQVKGFGRWRIIWQEALRNALIPTVALSGVQLTFLIGGTVLIEKIFSYPGIGTMAIDAVIGRDLPLIQGVVLTFAVTFILINMLVDISYGLLNPKVRHA